jgi:hypothetical protein
MELAELAGKSLLLPKDPAFHPHEEGLLWRVKQLVGVGLCSLFSVVGWEAR